MIAYKSTKVASLVGVFVVCGVGHPPTVFGGSWSSENVPVVQYSNLAFDPGAGHFWASGSAGVSERLGPGQWTLPETIPGYGGEGTSIAFSASGLPAVGNTLHHSHCVYSHKEPSGWETDTVKTGTCAYTSLAFKSDGHPGVAYERDASGYPYSVEYAEFDGASWNVEQLALCASSYKSLALDANNEPWIAYETATGSVDVVHRTGSVWSYETVQTGAANFSEQKLALDLGGVPVVAWIGGSGEGHLSRFDGSLWMAESEPFATNAKDSAALAFDPSTGLAAIAYRSLDENLWLARETLGGWTHELVRDDGGTDVYISLSLSGDGGIGILEGNTFWIPEPTALAVLAMGSLALLRRRA